MHQEAEFGVASHVGYKSSKQDSQKMDWFEKLTNIFKTDEKDNKALQKKQIQKEIERFHWVEDLAETSEEIN
jgi:(p)ppGpp synthase/HD superfamily hydrolase